jgi:hypothetical protein
LREIGNHTNRFVGPLPAIATGIPKIVSETNMIVGDITQTLHTLTEIVRALQKWSGQLPTLFGA